MIWQIYADNWLDVDVSGILVYSFCSISANVIPNVIE